MHIRTEHEMGALGDLLDPGGLRVQVAVLSKAELATLDKAGKILHALRATWDGDDNHVLDTDIALAAYTCGDIVECNGRIEVGYVNVND